MERFQALRSVAERAGCADVARKAEQTADNLLKQKRIKAVVTGMRGSGKTTLLNQMVNSHVREPGNMDDEEKPLRVSFEPMEDDERYDCKLVVNREWNSRDAILYELRDYEVYDDGALTPEMDDKDIVFFMIAANAPFNINEVRILKALSPFRRQVVLTSLDVIKPEEKRKILEYVDKINASLALPPVYVWEEDKDVGRDLRNLMPVWDESSELRQKRIDAIFAKALDDVESAVKAAQADNERQTEAASRNNAEAGTAVKRAQNNWYTLRADLLERQNKVSLEVTEGLKMAGNAAAQRLLKAGREVGFSEEWRKSFVREAVAAYENLFRARLDVLRDAYVKDVRKAASDAEFLNLMGYQRAEFADLEKYAPHEVSQAAGNASGQFTAPSVSKMPDIESDSFKVLIGTGALVIGFALVPLPPIVKALGATASAGVGGSMMMKKRGEEMEGEFARQYQVAFGKNLSVMQESLLDVTSKCYGQAIRFIDDKAKSLRADESDLTPMLDRKQCLEACLKSLETMRQ